MKKRVQDREDKRNSNENGRRKMETIKILKPEGKSLYSAVGRGAECFTEVTEREAKSLL
jgi:hypothetical protein